jgi:hypothetical protein
VVQPQSLANLTHNQRERLAYIDFRLYFFGEVGRKDLIERFGLAPAGATRDLALYREIAPKNITFDGSKKIYRVGQAFSPLFGHDAKRVLSVLAMGFGDGQNGQTLPLLSCESPTALSNPKMDVLAPICRAIHAKRPVAIHYHSMSSGASDRVIVPFALVDTGLRWHVRAFDRKSSEFRDFVVTRIESTSLRDEAPLACELPDNDIQWTRIVELNFVPHPRLERPEIIKMDYGMTSDSIKMRVRAAVAGYMLLRWSVDCSPDHRLKEEQYRLWLSDPLALYGVENAKLAPGYQAPTVQTLCKG